MSQVSYDFTAAADFLNEAVPLDQLHEYVYAAWRTMFSECLSKEKKDEVWETLHICLDFIETIQVKEGGEL